MISAFDANEELIRHPEHRYEMRIYAESATAKSDLEKMQSKGWNYHFHFFQDSTDKCVFVYRRPV